MKLDNTMKSKDPMHVLKGRLTQIGRIINSHSSRHCTTLQEHEISTAKVPVQLELVCIKVWYGVTLSCKRC